MLEGRRRWRPRAGWRAAARVRAIEETQHPLRMLLQQLRTHMRTRSVSKHARHKQVRAAKPVLTWRLCLTAFAGELRAEGEASGPHSCSRCLSCWRRSTCDVQGSELIRAAVIAELNACANVWSTVCVQSHRAAAL